MSMHKIPLTEIEESGLSIHRLSIGQPSQLSDCFRSGLMWAGRNPKKMGELQGIPKAGQKCVVWYKGTHSFDTLCEKPDTGPIWLKMNAKFGEEDGYLILESEE